MKDSGSTIKITDLILCLLLFILGSVLFLAYGHFEYPKQFQAQVPMTNMGDVERVLGRPVSVFTFPDGTIKWDYTHWWSGEAKVYFKTDGTYYRTFTDF